MGNIQFENTLPRTRNEKGSGRKIKERDKNSPKARQS